ncbi:flavonoid 3'-monooxygenase CYP75B137 [Beta vulgaris subsp. vulgaris]|uniref:flavonoid 3'-monooxygenase CYP75B137 n=1 Tax=Beta vulgaris subsp. vulgaris TaxID=3555 RepID=UPI0020374CE4|nr:flavonoid 3'-monooxygenase CYP75B137 [Beta vulgaris subsp. vulgaris]
MIFETWVVVPLLTLLTILWAIFILTKNRPPLPPGPLGLPILGNLLSLSPELHTYFTTLAQTHGPIFSLRLGMKLGVIISSANHAKEILKHHDVIFANRDVPIAGKTATYGGANIVWSPYGPTLRMLRKVCVREMLGSATLDSMYGLRRREVRSMVRRLSEKVGTKTVNVGEEVFMVVMRVVTDMLWGGTMVEEKEEERESIGLEFRVVIKEFTGLLGMPNVSDFFPGLDRIDLQGVERRMKRCVKLLDEIFEKVIYQRLRVCKEGKRREKDFLEVLLQMRDDYEGECSDDKVSFSTSHLKGLLMDMIVGGTDTTSNTVELTMAEIMNHPDVLKKIQQELNTVIGSDSIVEEHHIYKLPYLQAVLKEALRLHPVLPLLVPHCPSESRVVGGYTIPKGARVFINVWAIHRDPSVWTEPSKFDPERFLLDANQFDFNGNNFNYIPFGSGRRICAGIGLAERMVLFIMASLLHSFNWKLPEGEELNLEEKFGIVLSKRTPLVLIPECRLSDSGLYI